ncbi:MAG: hypothetical protein H8E55_01705, partial [Pelagibacterales bacterium]|nr:hypothetical protein [Pelagibacterales bacterium]
HDSAGDDFKAWEKFVVNGGVVIFHDFAPHSPEVVNDCENILKEFDNYELIHRPEWGVDSTSIFQIRKNEKI